MRCSERYGSEKALAGEQPLEGKDDVVGEDGSGEKNGFERRRICEGGTFRQGLRTYQTKSNSRHLNIGKHPREDLMSLDSDSLSFTGITAFDICIGMCSRSMTVCTDHFSGNLELLSVGSQSPSREECHSGEGDI